MLNGDPPLPVFTTEQIQKCLEENAELILAILEGQNQGKVAEIAQYQAKLQHNLTFLAKLADAGPQEQMHSQGRGMQMQHRPYHSPLDMNDQQQQQVAVSLQQPDFSTSKLAFQMNEQQHHKLPPFFQQQHQLIQEPMGSFPVTTYSGMYQASQTRLCNLPDMLSSINQIGSDVDPGWS